jgi:hypothetical protein
VHVHTARMVGKEYTLHVHTARVVGKEYILDVNTAGGDIHTERIAGGEKRYTLNKKIHTTDDENEDTLHFHMLAMEMDTRPL